MDKDRFIELVAEAVESLPEEFATRMENVDVVVEDWPTAQQLHTGQLPRDSTLFGLYEGVPLTKRHSGYGLVPPDKISIFQGPIEARYQNADEIKSEIQRVVIHEIAHHFGIDDSRLHQIEEEKRHH